MSNVYINYFEEEIEVELVKDIVETSMTYGDKMIRDKFINNLVLKYGGKTHPGIFALMEDSLIQASAWAEGILQIDCALSNSNEFKDKELKIKEMQDTIDLTRIYDMSKYFAFDEYGDITPKTQALAIALDMRCNVLSEELNEAFDRILNTSVLLEELIARCRAKMNKVIEEAGICYEIEVDGQAVINEDDKDMLLLLNLLGFEGIDNFKNDLKQKMNN